jgi:hypothetical protein
MRKLILIIFISLMWSGKVYSNNCTEKDEKYAKEDSELYGDKRTYNAEEAYNAGQTIINVFQAKDLNKLISMFDGELKKGPPISYFKNKTFDEAFNPSFQTLITNSKPRCGLSDSNKGFDLGDTLLWYDKSKSNKWVIREINYTPK